MCGCCGAGLVLEGNGVRHIVDGLDVVSLVVVAPGAYHLVGVVAAHAAVADVVGVSVQTVPHVLKALVFAIEIPGFASQVIKSLDKRGSGYDFRATVEEHVGCI